MKLLQLQYFSAICDCGSFTKAAEKLHVTQPSLSKAIKELEQVAGTQLLVRTKMGVEVTAEGQLFLEQTHTVLREVHELEQIIKSFRKREHPLKIGIPPTIGYCFIPQISKMVSRSESQIALDWKEGGTDSLAAKVHAGVLDAAIIPRGFVCLDDFSWCKFGEVEEVLFVAKGNLLAGQKIITPDLLERETFVLFSEEYNQNVPFHELFDKSGFYPQNVIYTSQLSTALNLIEKNMAVSILIRDISKQRPQNAALKAIPLSPPYYLELLIIWSKRFHLSREMKALLHILSREE